MPFTVLIRASLCTFPNKLHKDTGEAQYLNESDGPGSNSVKSFYFCQDDDDDDYVQTTED